MKSRRVLFLVMALAVALAVIAGCAPATATVAPTQAAVAAPEATTAPTEAVVVAPETSAFPLTIVDDLGREVTLDAPAERVVSLAPSNTEVLFGVGAGDQVVGVTEYCNYPPETESIDKIGGFSAKSISVETIVALEPDVVFSAGPIHQTVIDALQTLGIKVVALDPVTFDDVYASMELVGLLTGHEEEAAALVAAMSERVDAVAAKVAQVPEEDRLTVYWEIYDEPLMTAGPSTFVGQMVEIAGGKSIFGDITESYPEVSAEEIVSRNPDVIMSMDSHGEKIQPEFLSERPGWSEVTAVKEGRVYVFPDDWVSRASPRLADGLEAVAAALYPEQFAD